MRNRGQKKNVVDDSDKSGSESETAGSDDSVDRPRRANNRATPKRRRGRQPASKNKRRRIQDSSEDDDEPSQTQDDSDVDYTPDTAQSSASQVASTSQNGNNEVESEEESGSESPDSDYGPVNDTSPVRQKKPASNKRKLPPRASKSPKKYTFNTATSQNGSVNGHSSNTSDRGASSSRTLNGSHLNQSQNRRVSKSSQSNDVSLDTELVETLAQKVVYFLLIEDQKKYAIRRKVIIAHVFKDTVYSPKLYTAVIIKANIILKKVYGMELMELENQKDCYLIVNILRRELGIHDYVELPDPKRQQHGLITFILTLIFMNDNVITEQELTKSLKPLGIDLTSKKLHPVFGDVKKLITTELVKQMYLNYECISKEPPRYEYTWGLRAKQEFDKRDLLQYACQIIDDTSPEDWRFQFKDAENSAKSNVDS